MAIDATFSVNGNAVTGEVAVLAGSTVTLAISNTTGINLVTWSILGNDRSSRVNPTITPSGTPQGASATFQMPADDGIGQSYIVQARATDGSSPANNAFFSAVIGVQNQNGIIPIAAGEEFERSSSYGWLQPMNSVFMCAEARTVAVLQTTDASAQNVFSIPFTTGKLSRLNVRWVGKRSDGLQVAARESMIWIDNLSGTPAQLGSTVDLLATAKSDVTWGALDFVVGPTMVIRVAGKAATTINWNVSYSQLTY